MVGLLIFAQPIWQAASRDSEEQADYTPEDLSEVPGWPPVDRKHGDEGQSRQEADLSSQSHGGESVYKELLKSTAMVKGPMGQGSGCLVSRHDRQLVTNYHVVLDAAKVDVCFPAYDPSGKLIAEKLYYQHIFEKKESIRATVLKVLKGQDLALVQLEKLPSGVQALRLATSGVAPGQEVHSIGNPGVSDAAWVYTGGKVRSISHKTWAVGHRAYDADVVETQSPTNPGDSGGPLVNDAGELIAVTQGINLAARDMSYFIAVGEVRKLFDSRQPPPADAPAERNPSNQTEPTNPDVVRLILQLRDREAPERAQAASQLGQMGPEAATALKPLLRASKDDSELVREQALAALRLIIVPAPRTVRILAEALQDHDEEVRLYAAETLARIGAEAKPAFRMLLKAARDRSRAVREHASKALRSIDIPAKDDLGALIETLDDPDSAELRLYAAEALGKMGPDALFAAAALSKALREDQDSRVRCRCAVALGAIGHGAKEAALESPWRGAAFKPLLQALGNDNAAVRAAAAAALQDLPLIAEDVPVLVNVLQHEKSAEDLQVYAATCLGKIGKDARHGTFPVLIDALKSKHARVRAAAAVALKTLGPSTKEDLKQLIRTLEDHQAGVEAHRFAATALGEIGPRAQEGVSILLQALLNHDDPQTRLLAAEALGKIDPRTPDSAISLQKALGKCPRLDDKPVRLSITQTLAKMGPGAGALPGLLLAMEDTDAEVAETASKALDRAKDSLGREHVAELIRSLTNRNRAVRLWVAVALGKIGREANNAAKPLCAALNVLDKELSFAILESLLRIKPLPKEVAVSLANFIEEVEKENKSLSFRAAITLAKLDIKTEQKQTKEVAVPRLARSLRPDSIADVNNETSVGTRREARDCLILMGQPAVGALCEMVKTHRGGARGTEEWTLYGCVRLWSIQVLNEIAPKQHTEESEKLLYSLMKEDPVPAVRKAAVEAWKKVHNGR
jgi:HEAT repeat protein